MARKISIATFEYPPDRGGVGMYTMMLKEALVDAEVIRLRPGKRFFHYAIDLFSKRRTLGLLVVHGAFPLGTVANLYKRLFHIPYVLIFHGNDFDQARRSVIKRFFLRSYLRSAKRVVANSKALSQEIEAMSGREVHAVLPCLPSELISLHTSEREKGCFSLLTIARVVARKGHAEVLEAISPLEDIHYTICGDGPELPALKAYVLKHSMEHRVHFVIAETPQEKADLYEESSVFIMPTRVSDKDREGFGIVYLEAGYFQLPVIATRTKGVDEAVIDGETGLLVAPTVSAIRKAILQLQADVTLRETLGERGRVRVEREFLPEARESLIREVFYG